MQANGQATNEDACSSAQLEEWGERGEICVTFAYFAFRKFYQLVGRGAGCGVTKKRKK